MNIRTLFMMALQSTFVLSLAQDTTFTSSDTIVIYKTKGIEGKTVNGKSEGYWKYRFDSLKCDLQFKNGLKVGTQTSYYPSGKVMAIKNYNDKGLLHDSQYILYESGDTMIIEHYNQGIPHGKWSSFHPSKNLRSKAFYANGKVIHYSEYKDGEDRAFQSINNGKGKVKVLDGRSKTITYYESGLKHGKCISYFDDRVLSITEYKKGILVDETDSTTSQNTIEVFTVECRENSTLWNKKAYFDGGDIALQQHIAQNISYPTQALENDAMGIINCQYTVNTKGNIINCTYFSEKIGYGLEEESIRVILSTSYLWTPASQDGFPVEMEMRIPVKFQVF